MISNIKSTLLFFYRKIERNVQIDLLLTSNKKIDKNFWAWPYCGPNRTFKFFSLALLWCKLIFKIVELDPILVIIEIFFSLGFLWCKSNLKIFEVALSAEQTDFQNFRAWPFCGENRTFSYFLAWLYCGANRTLRFLSFALLRYN